MVGPPAMSPPLLLVLGLRSSPIGGPAFRNFARGR